ncbi:MAG: gamma-glutamyltransferase family protein, partial [Solirubrobacteraceae bacterium]
HMCGLGGDLFAVVVGAGGASPLALNASGRAGTGADPDAMRGEGHQRMPFQRDARSVTVPGFVDGLIALHARLATLGRDELLAPAIELAQHGFPVSRALAEASRELPAQVRATGFGADTALRAGRPQAVPGVAAALRAVASGGRAAFYEGSAGAELVKLGAGLFSEQDLAASSADWVTPLTLAAFGATLWTVPPNSQGYLALSGAWIADAVGVPADPDDELWAFALVESARQAARDRIAVLHEHADGAQLLSPARLRPRAEAVAERASRGLPDVYGRGGTTYVCAVDAARMGVSLIISNCAGFGSQLILPEHGIFLHNRGMGFSLTAGHPAELGPGRRPPHTLAPVAITDAAGGFRAVLGTMGGDAQPQILLQLLARTLVCGQDAGPAVAAPRWCLTREDQTGFRVWELEEPPIVTLEHAAPRGWAAGLSRRGYRVAHSGPGERGFGHAQLIEVAADNMLCGAADPRSARGAFVGR